MYTENRVLELICARARIDLQRQITAADHPDAGAVVWDHFGMPDPMLTAQSTRNFLYAYLEPRSPMCGDAGLRAAIDASIRYLTHRQRSSGRIDLSSTNFDSPPDTAFTLEWLCPTLDLARTIARSRSPLSDSAARIACKLERYLLPAALGVLDAGATTPNHRWGCCAALAHAMTQFPDQINARPYIDRFLAETIDQTADGEYTERSLGIYNAVINRSLRRLADHLNRPDLFDYVRRNLDLTLHFLGDDGSIITNASHRRDRGKRTVPVSLAPSFFDLANRDVNGRFATAADILINTPEARGEGENHLSVEWELMPYPITREVRRARLPDGFARTYPAGKMHRIKRGRFAATIAGDTLEPGTLQSGHVTITPNDGPSHNTTPLILQWGSVRVRSVKVCQALWAQGQFIGDIFEPISGGVRLTHRSKGRPEYVFAQPLGRPVPIGSFYAALPDREKVPLPAADMTLSVTEILSGVELRLQTHTPYDRVPVQVEIAIEGSGEWETESGVGLAQAGATTILKSGYGVFRRGTDAIRIGPGQGAGHRMWAMRGSEVASDSFRVLLAGLTPVDWRFRIEVGTFRVGEQRFEPSALVRDCEAEGKEPSISLAR